jgi:RNA polymerase sigma-70 factor, ECF subfamily
LSSSRRLRPVAEVALPDAATGTSAPELLRSSLLGRLRAGNQDAWRDLVDLYGPLIYGWCRRLGLSPEDARDVGQEVFRAIAAGLPKYRQGQPDSTFRGWVWTIMRNKVRDARRRPQPVAAGGSDAQVRLAELPDRMADDAPSSIEVSGLAHRAVERVQAEFEPRTWQAFWRATIDERPVGEVAAALGMSANAVRVARCKVLRRLREELGDFTP